MLTTQYIGKKLPIYRQITDISREDIAGLIFLHEISCWNPSIHDISAIYRRNIATFSSLVTTYDHFQLAWSFLALISTVFSKTLLRTKVPVQKNCGCAFFVMSDRHLMVRIHPDSRVSSYFIRPIQLSYEFFIIAHLILYGLSSSRHANFSWTNSFHPIS